jgi:hypothetical protein
MYHAALNKCKQMNREDLNRLLEKYYNGESTEEEELEIRLFFNGNIIPEGYEAERALFSYYNNAMEVPEPSADFEARIISGINGSEKTAQVRRSRKLILTVLSTAAGVIIMTGSYFFFVNRNETDDTYSDPKLAYAETMKILFDVSARMNKGAVMLEPVTRINDITTKSFTAINKTTNIVGKNLRSLDYLQKAIELTNTSIANSTNKK